MRIVETNVIITNATSVLAAAADGGRKRIQFQCYFMQGVSLFPKLAGTPFPNGILLYAPGDMVELDEATDGPLVTCEWDAFVYSNAGEATLAVTQYYEL